jgi:hypothetical protein
VNRSVHFRVHDSKALEFRVDNGQTTASTGRRKVIILLPPHHHKWYTSALERLINIHAFLPKAPLCLPSFYDYWAKIDTAGYISWDMLLLHFANRYQKFYSRLLSLPVYPTTSISSGLRRRLSRLGNFVSIMPLQV